MGEGDESKPAKPKRRRPGWFWRLVRSFCLLLFLLMGLAAGCAYWASHHLVDILDYLGERFIPYVQVGVSEVQFRGRTLEARGVVVSLPSEGRPVAVLQEVKADWEWSWEAGFLFESIRVNGMHVRLRPTDLAGLREAPRATSTSAEHRNGWLEQRLGRALDWRLDALKVNAGTFVIEPEAGVEVQGRFSLALQEIDAALSGDDTQRMRVEDLVVKLGGESLAEVEETTLEANFVGLRDRRLERLSTSGWTIDLRSDRMPDDETGGEKPVGEAQEVVPWEIERFELEKGAITYRHVLEGTEDLVVTTQFALPPTALHWPGTGEDPPMQWALSKLKVLEAGHPTPRIEVQEGALKVQLARLRESRSFDALRLQQGDVRIDPQLGEWLASWPKGDEEPASSGTPRESDVLVRLDALEVEAIRIVLRDLDPDLPTLSFPFQTSLSNLQWPPPKESVLTEAQVLEFGPLVVTSPLDPLTPVMRFPTIFVRFTPAELLEQHLQEVKILYPTIFVGPDLFWYIDVVQKRQESEGEPGRAEPVEKEKTWRIDQFVTEQGKLMLVTGRGRRIPLPIPFSARVNDINFASLAELQLQLDLEVPEADYRFPDYQLAFLNLSGAIDFSLPPGSNADNLVNKLTSEEIQFRQFDATKAWMSVTFDLDGAHGEFGGQAYSGYVNGGFTVAMEGPKGWSGWISGTGIDLDAITQILVPENLLWSGQADFNLTTKGFRQEVRELKGELQGQGGGTFSITKLDQMMERIPKEWSPLRQSIMELGLVTVRDFAYESAAGRFDYADRAGSLRLELESPETRRLLEIELHPPGTAPPPES